MRRYLHDDYSLSCDSAEYETVRRVAFALLALWPAAVPFLYALLLHASKRKGMQWLQERMIAA